MPVACKVWGLDPSPNPRQRVGEGALGAQKGALPQSFCAKLWGGEGAYFFGLAPFLAFWTASAGLSAARM